MLKNLESTLEFSIVVESFTNAEGGDDERFREVLTSAVEMTKDRSGEVLVTDVYDSSELESMLQADFPTVRRIPTPSMGYEAAKTIAAEAARGEYVLYLDGDCLPMEGWLDALLRPLKNGEAIAVGGHTRYDGGFLAAVQSVMDFGFFYPCKSRPLQCYASNNCGFQRNVWKEVPVPDADLRSRCFFHAQCLLRRGTPVQLVPEAKVLHEYQPVVRERTRQGYDTVMAAWSDPELPEARWVKLKIFSLPLFYGLNVVNDWKRAVVGRRELGLNPLQLLVALLLFPLFRLLDGYGMLRAFLVGPVEGGWGGVEKPEDSSSAAVQQRTAA